jgi:hypothetical protein
MESLKARWKRTHPRIRKPVVFIVGTILILAAAATGWLPGPGGIPLFLVGIAILATEFIWAERVRDRILVVLTAIGHWFKANKLLGTILAVLLATTTVLVIYLAYIRN